LGVTTATRVDVLPDVPSISEFVAGYEAANVNGIGVPGKTPAEIVMKLNGEINTILSDPAIKARFAQLGGAPMIGSSADYKAYLTAETDKWAKVVKAAGIKPG
jgi:tripartite-type tricarboxylate transporter receptor subunit TctC